MGLDLSATATKLLNKLATKTGSVIHIKIKRTTGATIDPVDGSSTGGTTTTTDMVGAQLRIPDSLLVDERVRKTDRLVIIDKAFAPLMSDTIVIDSVEYKVVSIDGFNHAGVQQFWRVVCRG